MAQLVEQSLPIPKVRGLNPVIDKIYIEHLLSTVLKRRKKEIDQDWSIFKNKLYIKNNKYNFKSIFPVILNVLFCMKHQG